MCWTKFSCLFAVVTTKSWPLDLPVLARLAAVGADHRERRLPAERRVGQHHRPARAGVGEQRVLHLDEARRRRAVPMPCSSRFIAASRAVPSTSSTPLTKPSRRWSRSVRRQALRVRGLRARGRRAGSRRCRRRDRRRCPSTVGSTTVDDRVDQRARREVLAGAGLDVLGALAQQLLVGVALDVDAGRRPVLLVDQVDDEPLELGRILDPVLRLAEDRRRACPAGGRAARGCAGTSISSSSPSASSSRCQEHSSGRSAPA